MDRFWLLTWTTYGTWLPGDRRGFVSNVREGSGPEVRHNAPGSLYDADMPGLELSARAILKGPPIYLGAEQAAALLEQFQSTAKYRGWTLPAAAVMANHVHLVVGVPGDPDPATVLHSFKAYGSRALNLRWKRPASGTWWAESGSRRKLPDESAVQAAIAYVYRQHCPLAVWPAPDSPGERGLSSP